MCVCRCNNIVTITTEIDLLRALSHTHYIYRFYGYNAWRWCIVSCSLTCAITLQSSNLITTYCKALTVWSKTFCIEISHILLLRYVSTYKPASRYIERELLLQVNLVKLRFRRTCSSMLESNRPADQWILHDMFCTHLCLLHSYNSHIHHTPHTYTTQHTLHTAHLYHCSAITTQCNPIRNCIKDRLGVNRGTNHVIMKYHPAAQQV